MKYAQRKKQDIHNATSWVVDHPDCWTDRHQSGTAVRLLTEHPTVPGVVDPLTSRLLDLFAADDRNDPDLSMAAHFHSLWAEGATEFVFADDYPGAHLITEDTRSRWILHKATT